jgi:fibronectin type 3 domain-containing protein
MSCSANKIRSKSFRFILWSLVAALSQLAALATQSVTLIWNPSSDTNVAGYRIYYGTVSQDYTSVVTVGNVTNATITGLADGTTYFFAATTLDAAGDESAFSNEATFSTAAAVVAPVNQPPTLNSLTNLTVYQNAGIQTIILSGITTGSPGEMQFLKVTVVASNANLIIKPTVNYVSPNSTGTLTFKPSPTLTGMASISVTVNDGGKSNNIINRTFSVTVVAPPNPNAPKFSLLLTNSTALAGQTISLGVAVTGKAPFKYQWKHNGTNLTKATSAALTLKNVKASQAGIYSVSVSNGYGSTNSNVAVLSIYTKTSGPLNAPVPATNSLANSTPPAAATLTSLTQTNGQFAFLLTGTTGSSYVVQSSSDLNTWLNMATNTAPFTFIDPNSGNFNQRFYRAYSYPQ